MSQSQATGNDTRHNDTSVSSTGTTLSPITTNVTFLNTTESPGSPSHVNVAIVVVCVVFGLVILGVAIYLLKRTGFFKSLSNGTPLKRRSSTCSSTRPFGLEPHDQEGSHAPDHRLHGDVDDDHFTIDDLDDVNAQDQEGYYYDEVFRQSQFEDKGTTNSVRQLVSDSDAPDVPDIDIEEQLDYDFETLGINIFKIDPSRKTTV